MTVKRTREEERDDPELQNEYNQTFLNVPQLLGWWLTVKKGGREILLTTKIIKIKIKNSKQKEVIIKQKGLTK